jgi:MYXO-CTERM domain-containing protein
MRARAAALAALAALAPAAAAAQRECPADAVGCHAEPVDFHWEEGLLGSMTFDTGWVPSGSVVQVRLALAVGGQTRIDLAGTTLTYWPRPLDVAVPGEVGTGFLSVDYGIEILARFRIDVTIAGTHYLWEGDLPLGGIPRDLRMAASETFDSFLLPPRTPRPVAIADSTEPVTVYEVGLTDSIISIPGISGGLVVDAQGELAAAYATERIEIADAPVPILVEDTSVVTRPGPGEVGLGAAKDVVVQPIGRLDYDGVIHLLPSLYVELAGRRFDVASFDVPVPIVMLGREVRFEPRVVHVPLPDVTIADVEIDFGEVAVGTRETRFADVRSEGEADLAIARRALAPPFETDTAEVTLAPRTSRLLEVRFAPLKPGPAAAMFFLETNDPDEPLLAVRLHGNGVAAIAADAGADGGRAPGTAGGCACRAGGAHGGSTPFVLASIALALIARRRRA